MNKVPNVTFVTANVQRLQQDRKRLDLFSRLRLKPADIFLLTEIGRPDERQVVQWTQECENAGLSALFTTNNQTAIIWKPSAVIAELDPPQRNVLRADCQFSDRITDIGLKIGSFSIRVVSIYAISQSGNKNAFLDDLNAVLHRHPTRHSLVMGGDWNCVESVKLDAEAGAHQRGAPGREGEEAMKRISLGHALTDVYRSRHPSGRLFTNDSGIGRTQRRLDRIYISADMVPLLKSETTWVKLTESTHIPVAARFYVPGAVEIGPGKFKLGLHTVTEGPTAEWVTDIIEELYRQARVEFPDDPLQAWASTKIHLQPRLQDLAIALSRFRRKYKPEEHELAGQYGSALRARIDPTLAGASSIFIRLRQVRAKDLTPSLSVNDEKLSEPDEMLGAARDFYQSLYDDKAFSQEALAEVCANFDRFMPPKDRAKLEEDYDMAEMSKAVEKCKTRASPGPDGLPVEFYSLTWRVTGPILRDIINFIATREPDELPPKVAHLHLIHKKGAHDILANKRPISLINADERILSKAHNRRLAPLLHRVVAPTQTGFIPGRLIDTNIASMQAAFDAPPPGLMQASGLMAVMDFEKAYDRIAHGYLEAVLKHLRFGPKAIRWYMATCVGQTAQIFLNGWISTPLVVRSGVRQGDPLAPSLFALAIEGFAATIRKRVTGFELFYPGSIKELLFADDAACGLRDFKDAGNLVNAIALYERASASRLSREKSFIVPIGARRDSAPASWRGWRVSKEPFRYLGVRVGVGVNNDEWWETTKSAVIRRIRTIPMWDLPLAARTMIINTYCYSKVLFYDRFSPAPPAVIEAIEVAAQAAIWQEKQDARDKRGRLVSTIRLQTPIDHGGFGLFNLAMQLDLARAKWIYKLLSGRNSKTSRPLLDIRSRLVCACLQRDFVRRVGSFPNFSFIKWTWPALLCHPDSLDFLGAINAAQATLPARWIEFLRAWERTTKLRDGLEKDRGKWNERVLNLSSDVFVTIPSALFYGPDGEKLEEGGSFTKATASYHTKQFPLLKPDGHERKFAFGERRWKAWWPFLRRVRIRQSDAANTQHLLSLGSLHPGAHLGGKPNADRPNNSSKACVLCLKDDVETLQHLFLDCEVAKLLWTALQPEPAPAYRDLVCPAATKSQTASLTRQAIIIDVLWHLARQRRFSLSPLSPIPNRDLVRIIRKTRARIAGRR